MATAMPRAALGECAGAINGTWSYQGSESRLETCLRGLLTRCLPRSCRKTGPASFSYASKSYCLLAMAYVGEPGWDRTSDLLIKSQLLYH
jgi:hypothetical protein